MINLTLNQLKRPALSNLVPKFGTKVEKNDINKGGLSTEEVDRNITLPFELMREVEVSSSDTTTKIQYDAKIAIVGSDPVTLTLDKASYKGCVITITNRSTEQATIVLSEDNQKNIESKKSLVLEWDGTAWNDTALVVDSTVSEESNKPVSSAAVYQKATEITEAYTQAIASETTARSEAITAIEQKVTEETNARTQADTALGTRIDGEVGTLSALTTTAKDNVVAAINELDTDIGNEVTAREQADTVLGTRIDTEVGTLSALTTTAKDNVVAAINEVNGKVGAGSGGLATSHMQFTFVVDSNAKLTAWANATVGNDYTSVLIKKGEWTSNTGVNLTTAGTKVVVGESGSKLVFNGAEGCIYYDTPPNKPEYYMLGVTVEGTSNSYGFNSCANLTNCTGTGSNTGFHLCSNLTNCTGTGISYGFNSCANLTNCTGTGTGADNGCGFKLCNNVIGCKAGGHCTTTVFENCYASSSNTSTYACADTPNGGFNNTTNPPEQ